jgi:hypothetical protein
MRSTSAIPLNTNTPPLSGDGVFRLPRSYRGTVTLVASVIAVSDPEPKS